MVNLLAFYCQWAYISPQAAHPANRRSGKEIEMKTFETLDQAADYADQLEARGMDVEIVPAADGYSVQRFESDSIVYLAY